MYADSAAHDGQVMQGFADGHIVVIGHRSQEVKLCCPKEYSKKILSQAASKADEFISCCQAGQKPWNENGCEGIRRRNSGGRNTWES